MAYKPSEEVGAVIVDYDTPHDLANCIYSFLKEGVGPIVVVENGDYAPAGFVIEQLKSLGHNGSGDLSKDRVAVISPGKNIGYGAGANRGMAALVGSIRDGVTPRYVLISNADVTLHEGAVKALTKALDKEATWAIVGPRVLASDGSIYPSVRGFPSPIDAVGHALLGIVAPNNRFSSRYRPKEAGGNKGGAVGWVSGSCFLTRSDAFEELGGFDESYFMFAEEMDLCWRAHEANWGVGFEPTAVVSHHEGRARAAHPYRMLLEHHRSALRFGVRSTKGWKKIGILLAPIVLGFRFLLACIYMTARRSSPRNDAKNPPLEVR